MDMLYFPNVGGILPTVAGDGPGAGRQGEEGRDGG
jgi:hypothetical protein